MKCVTHLESMKNLAAFREVFLMSRKIVFYLCMTATQQCKTAEAEECE
ncbi:hypothetical protein KS4_32100 [Poriferisphaera corsica]|uniref:Uncharacterized protein n=1 Tax=Poriferisphaera corsica TaxID=2528020 RepID=A0A517YY24_9BACT|nr:hypothetical protein KS4_32100 [Poriferisphaera corsica]